jgi:hypothetical protein
VLGGEGREVVDAGLTWRVVLIWRSAGAIQRAFAGAAAATAVREGQGKKRM